MRAPSEATQLRNARSELKTLQALLAQVTSERDAYRARATKAEQEAKEWKQRFDLLLSKCGEMKKDCQS